VLLAGLEKRKTQVTDPAHVTRSDALVLNCLTAHKALVSTETVLIFKIPLLRSPP
jgi:hypothetical protein